MPNRLFFRITIMFFIHFYVFSELLRLAATLDLSINDSLGRLKQEIESLELILEAHAEHEENYIHSILKNKNSLLFEEAENQHQDQKNFFKKLTKKIDLTHKLETNEIAFIGHEIYLDLRNFFSANLNHFDYEERIIMSELQRLLTDEEIRKIDRIG